MTERAEPYIERIKSKPEGVYFCSIQSYIACDDEGFLDLILFVGGTV